MFHKFEHYSNVNCVFTRAYVSLSNKYKGIDSLATLSDGLSLNINSESFNFKWKLLEAIPIKVKQEGIIWWQLCLCQYILMFSHLELTFPNVHIGVSEGDVLFRKHHCRFCFLLENFYTIHTIHTKFHPGTSGMRKKVVVWSLLHIFVIIYMYIYIY